MWEERVADMEKIVGVTRRRAEHKEKKSKAPEVSSETMYLSWIWTSITTVMLC